jgi:hypothetical protein
MARPRKARSDSIESGVKRIASIAQELAPPLKLTDREREVYDDILKSREASSWSKYDLREACNLAKTQILLEDTRDQLLIEGVVLEDQRGKPMSNPRFTAMGQTVTQLHSYARLLGLSASQRGLTDGEAKARNSADATARSVIEKASSDDLLA